MGIVVKTENESDFYEWRQQLGGYVGRMVVLRHAGCEWLRGKKWLTALLTFNGIVETV